MDLPMTASSARKRPVGQNRIAGFKPPSLSVAVALLFVLAPPYMPAAEIGSDSAEASESVYVRIERAMLYSGPSEDFYPTDRIAPAEELAVFHRTSDGWLGVRPVSSSFSWVPARQAYLLPGGKEIEITKDAVSWIGSSLGRAKQFRWQVKLHKGEQLRLLGESTVKNEEGKPVLWYRIAPPPGEFRWIQESAVSSKPVVIVRADSAASTPSSPVQTASVEQASASGGVVTAQHSIVENLPMQSDVFSNRPAEEISSEPAMLEDAVEGMVYNEDGTIYNGPVNVDGMHGDIFSGEYVDGEIVSGEMMGGEVVMEGPVPSSRPADHFSGWHAMEFSDEGMFFPWMAKLFSSAPKHDPLAHDPFSLEPMPKRNRSAAASVPQEVIVAQPRSHLHSVPGVYVPRNRPWRDPRNLRQQRPGSNSLPAPNAPSANDPGSNSSTAAPETLNAPANTSPSPDNDAYYGNGNTGPLAAAQDRIDSVRAALRDSLKRYQSSGELSAPEEREISTGIERALDRFTPSKAPFSQRSPYGGNGGSGGGSGQLQSDPNSVNWYGVSGDTAMNPRQANTTLAGYTSSSLPTVEQLLIALSETVARPVGLWQLNDVAAQAQQIVDHGANAIERGQARLLLERISEFDRAARQTGSVSPRGNPFSLASGGLGSASIGLASATSTQAAVPLARSAEDQAKYDATGWLVLVHGATAGKPPYALTDRAGQILAYVSGLPGLKFDAYLNKPVGVNGRRGYLPQLQAAHIQAQRMHELR